MTETIKGGCFCGAIRYELEPGERIVANCHCTMCRRTSGAPYVTWLVAPATSFTYTKGEPTVLNSSDIGVRYFCNQCGTPILCVIKKRPDEVDITVGSLDEPERYTPTFEAHADTRLPWVHVRES